MFSVGIRRWMGGASTTAEVWTSFSWKEAPAALLRPAAGRLASYAELAALYGHLAKTGALQSAPGGTVLPTGLETGDITERRDYLGMIDRPGRLSVRGWV